MAFLTIVQKEVAAVAVDNSSARPPVGIEVLAAWAVVNTDSSDTLGLAHFHGIALNGRTVSNVQMSCTSMPQHIDSAAYFRRW